MQRPCHLKWRALSFNQMPELENLQYERFCVEYLIDFNGKRSAEAAGFTPGDAATVQASRLLTHDNIQARIKELHTGALTHIQATAEMVINELRRIAACDVGEAFEEDGTPKPIKQIPVDVRRCISGFEVEEIFEGTGRDRTYVGKLRKVKFWDKNKGLELLGKHFKLFTEKFEGSMELSLERLIEGDAKKHDRLG